MASKYHSFKRAMGIEPTYPAWKAGVLPLNYARIIGVTGFEPATSWSQTRRSSQAEPHPGICHSIYFMLVPTVVAQIILYYRKNRLSTVFSDFLLISAMPGYSSEVGLTERNRWYRLYLVGTIGFFIQRSGILCQIS